MKNLFIVLGLLISVSFIGCATSKPAFHSTIPSDCVYIDPYNSWTNQCPVGPLMNGMCEFPWRSITIRVINKKYRDVSVTIECVYKDNDLFGLFGKKTDVVKKRNDATFLIWGMTRQPLQSEYVNCQITDVR
jgi:hypothetical protein